MTRSRKDANKNIEKVNLVLHLLILALVVYLVFRVNGTPTYGIPLPRSTPVIDEYQKELDILRAQLIELREQLHEMKSTDKALYIPEQYELDEPTSQKEDFNEKSISFAHSTSNLKQTDNNVKVEEQNIDDPLSMACMFNLCMEHVIDFFTVGGSYHLISSVYKPFTDEKTPSSLCELGIIITTMPHSGASLQAAIIAELLSLGSRLKYKGSFLWNWHAHSQSKEAKVWLDSFDKWKSSLNVNDYVIIYAPYYDDITAKSLCKTSLVISGYRSLVDIALIRGQSEKSYEEKELIKYSRSVKHHHDKFTKIADITTRFEDIMEENVDYGMMSFLLEVCDNLGRFGNILFPSVKCSSEIHPLVDILNPNRKPFQVFQRLQENMVKFRNHQRKDDSLARNAEHTFRTWLSNKGYLR